MYDLIIIGGGITGQSAAIYASRKRMKFLLITRGLGGQFLESSEILNYPGILKTTGAEFKSIMEEQLKFNDVTVSDGEAVERIEKIKEGFRVFSDKETYDTKSLIIATGAVPRKLNVPGEKEFAKNGVTYCYICDAPLFSGKDVAIIGGGNSALEAVDFTKDIARKIYLINNLKGFTAHEYLIERAESYKNVEIIHEANTKEIFGDTFVKGLKYEKGGKINSIDVEGIIIEIGRVPNTGFLKGFLELDNDGHIVIDCQTRTSVEGVFAAGDCTSIHEYQYIIAAGQGCMALLKVAGYLAGKRL